jgi:hypothetical protein
MANMRRIKISKFWAVVIGLVLIVGLLSTDWSTSNSKPIYGVSFSKFHSDELGLDWKDTYLNILDDLKVKNFRLSAHWPMVEPEEGKYNFKELDFQIKEAEKRSATVVLAVGRRLPGWPECHEPYWLLNRTLEEKQGAIIKYISAVVLRYRDSKAVKYWQVENEPFLGFFSRPLCGPLDETFLKKEIQLVHSLDPSRKVIITDSGEFGLWYKAYSFSDVFGTSMYLYIWNHKFGPLRYPITPAFFRIKQNIVKIFYGDKPSFVIELSSEPWLLQPIASTSMEVQFERMGPDKFEEMLSFSSRTGFNTFYLWGAEWWYWLKLRGVSTHWDRAKKLF